MRKVKKVIVLITNCKILSFMKIMTLLKEEAPANFVPAAAVIRRGRALSRMIGRKVSVDGYKFISS